MASRLRVAFERRCHHLIAVVEAAAVTDVERRWDLRTTLEFLAIRVPWQHWSLPWIPRKGSLLQSSISAYLFATRGIGGGFYRVFIEEIEASVSVIAIPEIASVNRTFF